MPRYSDATAPAVVTIGTSAGVVLTSRTGIRRAFAVQNTHASNVLYLGFGTNSADVTTSTGLRLNPGEMYSDNEPSCYSGAVHGIASGAGTTARVVEFY